MASQAAREEHTAPPSIVRRTQQRRPEPAAPRAAMALHAVEEGEEEEGEQVKVCGYWRVSRKLQRERADGQALARCMQELRMKGAGFDLTKELQASKKMKSSSVEINWRPLR